MTAAGRLDQITGPICQTAEAPIWAPELGGLVWVDIPAGEVLRFDAAGEVERWSVGPIVAAVRPRVSGGLVLGLQRGFGVAAGWGEPVTRFDDLWSATDLRFNDGACAPDGSFFCGSTATDYRPGPGQIGRAHV